MEQVFNLVNDLLTEDSQTLRRQLRVRTYNVLTLAEECGVIQFVTNTSALADWLTAAHER